jgi:hypothetical protein
MSLVSSWAVIVVYNVNYVFVELLSQRHNVRYKQQSILSTYQRHNVRYKQQSILSNFTKDIMYVINNNQYSVTHQRHNLRY